MTKELLSPDTLTSQLRARRLELHNLLTLKLKAQKNTPAGHLRIEQKNGGRRIQFYHCTSPANKRGAYIPCSQAALAQSLAQKDYDAKLIKLLRRQLSALEKLLNISEPKITELYTKLCPARQRLINPVRLTDAQYIKAWQEVQWQGRPFAAESPEFTTIRGERVRSKSEVIIADILTRCGIPYRYEFPQKLKNGRIFHPDFFCLNVRTRQEYLWEHFGMMDNPDYATQTAEKLKIFAEHNIFPGRNLIITMETQQSPLKPLQVEKLIKEFLK